VRGEGRGCRDGGGGGEGVGVNFGGGEEAVAGLVRPVERNGGGERDEECVKGNEGLVNAELVTETGPRCR
jgi:hypothetical protein